MNRREMLGGLGALAVTSGMVGCVTAEKTNKLDNFGLQLSTITPILVADFPGTLATVAAIGYPQVEFSALGFLGRDVQEVEDLLAANNLTAPVGRVSPKMPVEFFSLSRAEQMKMFRERGGPEHLLANVEAGIADAKHLGQRELVLPGLPPQLFESMSQVDRNIELLRQAGALCASEGLRFGYHNHDYELAPIDGVVPYQRMIEETDPDQVTFQLDVYWVTKAGGDIFEYLARYPGRFSSCHLKDIDDAGDFADVGDGNIDFPAFTRQALAEGIQHYFVERDQPPQPMQSIRRSYAYLKQMTF